MVEQTPPAPRVPYWRLSGFYFWYFALLGALFPYWSLYLQSLDYSPAEIGVLLAIPMATKIIAPSIWGWLADHTHKRLFIIRVGSALAMLCFSGLFLRNDFAALIVILASYSFFWNAVLPQHEVITLSYLPHKPEAYSHIRLWGSVGFILAVVLGGAWFEYSDISSLPVIGLLLLAAIWLSSLAIPNPPKVVHKPAATHFLAVCKHPVILTFLAGAFLLQLAHGVYYSFFSIFLEGKGYSRSAIGLFWGIGVASEVIVFITMHNFLPRLGVRPMLMFSLAMAVIRWVLIGHFAGQLSLLVFAQILHAFTFGTFHAASIEAVRRLFDPVHQGKGQAIYSGVSFGAGGAAGSLIAGSLWELRPTLAYDVAALTSFIALLVLFFWMKDDRLKN